MVSRESLAWSRRCRTAPDAIFAAIAGFLDGLRSMLDANDALKAQIATHYVQRQPPPDPRAVDFLTDLARVRNWRFDPEGMGETLREACSLLHQASRALAETAVPWLGEGDRDRDQKTFRFDQVTYTIQDQLSVEFTHEFLVITGFRPGLVSAVALKFAHRDLPPNRRYACKFAADMQNFFDLRDPDLVLEKDGYAYAILEVNREIKRSLTVQFVPGEPFALLRSIEAERGRRWFIGVR